MHIPPSVPEVLSISLDAAVNNRQQDEAERARAIRKRLLRQAQGIDADPDATLLVDQWLGAHEVPALPGDEYTPSNSDIDLD